MAAKDKNLGQCPARRDFGGFVKVAKTNTIYLKLLNYSLLGPRMPLCKANWYTFQDQM